MRDLLNESLKDAVKAKDSRRACTLRLINAAIKDRDIAVRSDGSDKLSDAGILELLAKMVKQREESTRIYEEAGRLDLAEQEIQEIEIIRSFMPKQLSDEEMSSAVVRVIGETGAEGLRDMGKIMSALKAQFPGQIDACKASSVAKHHLSAPES
ncbi:MAG: GatB/YqeY domain-containing protein [Devosiaceae bacterium]|nr:GatB/YqeY domain-containing protein [Devosiaceae bacterium MH13]